MLMDSLVNRYALGLFSIAIEENKILEYKNSIKMLKEIISNNNELLHLFSSCFILQEEKEDVINKIFVDFDEYIINFVKIIVLNKRTNQMIEIFNEFNKMCNARLNIKEGIIYSTEKLTNQDIKKVEKKFTSLLSCEVELENLIDEKLIGGYKVVIEDKVYDGSIKNKLEFMKLSLKQGGLK